MAKTDTTAAIEFNIREALYSLDRIEQLGERAFALGIVLRDRIESQNESERDPTSMILSQMLIDELEFPSVRMIRDCISELVEKTKSAVN
mgnify:CR=1 FL=1